MIGATIESGREHLLDAGQYQQTATVEDIFAPQETEV